MAACLESTMSWDKHSAIILENNGSSGSLLRLNTRLKKGEVVQGAPPPERKVPKRDTGLGKAKENNQEVLEGKGERESSGFWLGEIKDQG